MPADLSLYAGLHQGKFNRTCSDCDNLWNLYAFCCAVFKDEGSGFELSRTSVDERLKQSTLKERSSNEMEGVTMRAGIVYAKEDIRYDEIEKPVPKPGQVLIKVKYLHFPCPQALPCNFFYKKQFHI